MRDSCRWSAGFLGDFPFLHLLHSNAASHSPHFHLIGFQDLDAKRRSNLTYPFTRDFQQTDREKNESLAAAVGARKLSPVVPLARLRAIKARQDTKRWQGRAEDDWREREGGILVARRVFALAQHHLVVHPVDALVEDLDALVGDGGQEVGEVRVPGGERLLLDGIGRGSAEDAQRLQERRVVFLVLVEQPIAVQQPALVVEEDEQAVVGPARQVVRGRVHHGRVPLLVEEVVDDAVEVGGEVVEDDKIGPLREVDEAGSSCDTFCVSTTARSSCHCARDMRGCTRDHCTPRYRTRASDDGTTLQAEHLALDLVRVLAVTAAARRAVLEDDATVLHAAAAFLEPHHDRVADVASPRVVVGDAEASRQRLLNERAPVGAIEQPVLLQVAVPGGGWLRPEVMRGRRWWRLLRARHLHEESDTLEGLECAVAGGGRLRQDVEWYRDTSE
ncbi:hypothetical protein PR048_012391 [Dryococelus australis]|uniref:Ig-like domain-containing protein n=1 Tax=Dryococelus australis TaxID=614101 RepID=A0ABQ9HPB6_9NEOP|nr:hypothetical protein PR048_012391 [Dryococelus australis]